jgi:4-hydroxybenzoyl-CoA thioesterase
MAVSQVDNRRQRREERVSETASAPGAGGRPGQPFRFRRVVRWGDCDPAGIIYTPRVFDFAMEAIEAWWREVVGVNWYDLNWIHQMGAPSVRMECDFLRPLKPDQVVGVEVRVERIGRTSLILNAIGFDEAGQHCFAAKQVACVISRSGFTPIEIPAHLRDRMTAYQTACGDG